MWLATAGGLELGPGHSRVVGLGAHLRDTEGLREGLCRSLGAHLPARNAHSEASLAVEIAAVAGVPHVPVAVRVGEVYLVVNRTLNFTLYTHE